MFLFQGILKEIDEDFSEEELDGIIGEVRAILRFLSIYLPNMI